MNIALKYFSNDQNIFRLFIKRMNHRAWAGFGVVIALIVGITWLSPTLIFFLSIGVLGIALITRNLFWGWLIAMAFFPFSEWYIPLGAGHFAPVSDILGVMVFIAWAILWIQDPKSIRFPKIVAWSFGLFVLFGIVSIVNSFDPNFSFLYLLRFVIFNFIIYVFLPLQILRWDHQQKAVANLLVFIGVLVGLMGLLSLIIRPEYADFFRVTPLMIGGIFPIGSRPNLLAEILIPIIPITWAWAITQTKTRCQQWGLGVVGLLIFITLLTLSRAAWLSLGLMGLIFLFRFYRKMIRKMILQPWVIGFLSIPMLVMGIFLSSDVVTSSNENRLMLHQISQDLYHRHPFIGNGIGSFIQHVSFEKYYFFEFGAPLDAHGLIDKLLAETGVLGLLFFLIFLTSIITVLIIAIHRSVEPKRQIWLFAYLMAVVGMSIAQLFNNTYFLPKYWFILGVALAVACLGKMEKKDEKLASD